MKITTTTIKHTIVKFFHDTSASFILVSFVYGAKRGAVAPPSRLLYSGNHIHDEHNQIENA
jgi:hypothetical protein